MKENELRVGNLVIDNCEVIEVEAYQIYILASEFKPIPLTEEWLLKFGFYKMTDTQPYNYRIHKSKMFFYIRYGTFTTDGGKTDLVGFNGLFVGGKFVRVIKHVHQLQNLYFALTGEELTINRYNEKDENNRNKTGVGGILP